MKKAVLLSFVAVFTFALAFSPAGVFAVDGTSSTDTTTTNTDGSGTSSTRRQQIELKIQQAKEQAQTRLEQAKSEVKTKLATVRLKVCQNRTTRINQLLQNNSERAQKVLTKFEGIATKVEGYVTKNSITVSNYDTLVADVNAKDIAAAAAIGTVSGTTFNCDSQDANAVGKFQTGVVRDELNALKDYRTSIKTLIAAVKTAVPTGSVNNSGSTQ